MGEEQMDVEMRAEFENSKEIQNDRLALIRYRIFAYGSHEAIKIFAKFEELVHDSGTNQTDIKVYYLLPLLLVQVIMDVTGEAINPLVFLNSLMPEFRDHNDLARDYINENIKLLELSDALKIF